MPSALSTYQQMQLRQILGDTADALGRRLADLFEASVATRIAELHFLTDGDGLTCEETLPQTPVHVVQQQCSGALDATAIVVLQPAMAEALGSVCLADEGDTIDEVELEAELEDVLAEIGNIIINGLLGHLLGGLRRGVHFHLPLCRRGPLDEVTRVWRRQPGPFCHVGLRIVTGEIDVQPCFFLRMQPEAWRLIGTQWAQTSLEAS